MHYDYFDNGTAAGRPSTTPAAGGDDYTYDRLDRLETVKYPADPAEPSGRLHDVQLRPRRERVGEAVTEGRRQHAPLVADGELRRPQSPGPSRRPPRPDPHVASTTTGTEISEADQQPGRPAEQRRLLVPVRPQGPARRGLRTVTTPGPRLPTASPRTRRS